MTNNTKIKYAKEYFRKAHNSIKQKRKYSGEPYWVHTEAVAQLVWNATHDENLTIAALGHDTLEDVAPLNHQYDEYIMLKEFGEVITNLVKELTNVYTKKTYPNLNRKQRKHLEHKRLSEISDDAKTIKLADMIDNVCGIAEQDSDFGRIFLLEKSQVLFGLKGGNSILYNKAIQSVNNEISKLNKK